MTTIFYPPSGFITGEFVAPANTVMPFHLAAPPLGWTQNVAAGLSDGSMRATNVGTSSGGSTAWTSWAGGNVLNTNSFTLSTSQLPAHSHGVNDSGHSHTFAVVMWTYDGTSAASQGFGVGGPQCVATGTSNDAGLSSNNNGSSASITTTFTSAAVKFTNFCVATKS